MKYVSFSIMRPATVAGFVCLMFGGFVLTVSGQAARSVATTGRRLDDFNRQSEKVARDEMEGEMRGRKPTAEERRAAEMKKAQIKEDFETLQTTYNDILTRLHAKETLTNQYISAVTEKLAKSGSRLRHNIEFPEKAPDESKGEPPAAEPVSVKTLCIYVHAFLTSPIFETGVLNIVEAAKARDALDKIIKSSENIRHQLGKIE